MFEHDSLEELVFLAENGGEFDAGKAHEELSRRGYTLEEACDVLDDD